jgi:hypothetical protein
MLGPAGVWPDGPCDARGESTRIATREHGETQARLASPLSGIYRRPAPLFLPRRLLSGCPDAGFPDGLAAAVRVPRRWGTARLERGPDELWPGAREQGEQHKREWQERQDAEKEAWEAVRAAAGGRRRSRDEVRDLYLAELRARGLDVPDGPLLEAMVDMLTGHRVRGDSAARQGNRRVHEACLSARSLAQGQELTYGDVDDGRTRCRQANGSVWGRRSRWLHSPDALRRQLAMALAVGVAGAGPAGVVRMLLSFPVPAWRTGPCPAACLRGILHLPRVSAVQGGAGAVGGAAGRHGSGP